MSPTDQLQEVTPPSEFCDAWEQRLLAGDSVDPLERWTWLPGDAALAVVAHPDDETLAMGATLAHLAAAGVRVHVVSLTSGENALSHVGRHPAGLREARRRELQDAAAELGIEPAEALDWPDGGLSADPTGLRDEVATTLRMLAPRLLLTLWSGDPHPDHAAVGRAVTDVAREAGVPIASMGLWTMHWTDPAAVRETVARVDTSVEAQRRRQRAMLAYRSQTEPLADDLGPVLPASVVTWSHECLVLA